MPPFVRMVVTETPPSVSTASGSVRDQAARLGSGGQDSEQLRHRSHQVAAAQVSNFNALPPTPLNFRRCGKHQTSTYKTAAARLKRQRLRGSNVSIYFPAASNRGCTRQTSAAVRIKRQPRSVSRQDLAGGGLGRL